ncbi:aminotransferase-like domain-containing protein [Pseudoxanthomonas wuyuanensis]
MKRYQALAEELTRSIRSGLLKPGDRLPSVRHASASRGISPATVFEAYYLLEARGLVQARPRSGYYVSPMPPPALPAEPETASQPDGQSRPVEISERVFQVLESTMHRDVVPLGSAFPSPLHFPLDKLGRALAASATTLDPWSTVDDLTPGNADLRRQIALRYLIDGVQVDPREIVVSNGALEALNLCLSALTRPGDTVVVESPCFYAALQALEQQGLHALEVATDPREGIDLAALETAIERHRPAACWLMTNFQNPLGSAMAADKKRALVELLARSRLPLIEDDVYAELYFGARPVPTRAFDRDGWVLHCSSFSKSLAPGYRIGWVSSPRFARQLARQKLVSTLATCVPAQAALARYLERGTYDRHLQHLRRQLQLSQGQYTDAIARHFPAGTRVSRPGGGYFLWLELPGGIDTLALQRRAADAGISLAPGPIFSASRGFRHCLRLNYGHPFDARAEAALKTLGQWLAE